MPRAATLEIGPYLLGERIGEGGSGQIYRATGPTGAVAVKVLGPATDLDEAARARFAREIAALQQLAHPHLVRLLDHGVDPELGPYLVLPLLPGPNLRALWTGHALCPEAALLLLEPIARAVSALHAAGYVHRDLKPENAIAGPDGHVTVIDLGLAWRDGMTRHTDTGAAVGSVGYMAPEQIEGRGVDGSADVWALGVMLYEAIAGKRPFARPRAAEEAAAVVFGACARLDAADRRCDEALADLAARCLAVEPAARPTAAELAAALAARIDWTDAPDAERAAVVADPAGYQTRVAPFRVRRVERLARAALDEGKPFAALACCDRGLAYAPEHPELLALVARAEQATAPAPAVAAVTAPEPVIASRSVAMAMWSARARWRWPAIALAGVLVGALVTYLVVPAPRSGAYDPWSSAPRPPPTAAELAHDKELEASHAKDRALAGDIVGLLGVAVDRIPAGSANAPAPTLADGWLDRAKSLPPREAAEAVRKALLLEPNRPDARAALCKALVESHAPEALAACDEAYAIAPHLPGVAAWREAAHRADACARGDAASCDPWH